jgi:hypothetical protein
MAYTTPPSSGRHDLLTCKQGGVIGQPASDRFGAISTSDFVYLSVGWIAYTQALANNFLGEQFGTITVHQGSPTGAVVQPASGSWTKADVTNWTAPALFAVPSPGSGPQQQWMTRLYWPVGQLATGTYYVVTSICRSRSLRSTETRSTRASTSG